MSWNKKLEGLLGSPMFNMGVGLLAAGGTRRGPKINMGQALMEAGQYATGRQRQLNQLEAERAALDQAKQQQAATRRLGSILSTPVQSQQQIRNNVMGQMGINNVGAGLLNPQTLSKINQQTQAGVNLQNAIQGQIPGLMAQVAPQAYVQGAMAGQNRTTMPSKIRETVLATGIQPGQPGFLEAHQKLHGGMDAETMARLKLLGIQTEAAEADLADTRREGTMEVAGLKRTTSESLQSLAELYKANQALEGSFLESGRVFPSQRSSLMRGVVELGELFGEDTDEARELLKNYDIFSKETQLLTGSLASQLEASTNLRFQSVANSIPNLGLDPSANKRLILSAMQNILTGAEDMGIELDAADMEYYKNFLLEPPAGFVDEEQ